MRKYWEISILFSKDLWKGYLCVCMCAYMSLCTLGWGYHWSLGGGIRIPGADVTRGCEPPGMDAGNQTWILSKSINNSTDQLSFLLYILTFKNTACHCLGYLLLKIKMEKISLLDLNMQRECIFTYGVLAHIADLIYMNKIQHVPNYSTWLYEGNRVTSSRAWTGVWKHKQLEKSEDI